MSALLDGILEIHTFEADTIYDDGECVIREASHSKSRQMLIYRHDLLHANIHFSKQQCEAIVNLCGEVLSEGAAAFLRGLK